MVVLVPSFRVDRTQVPECDRQDRVSWQGRVVDWQSEPLVPDSAMLKMLIWRLRVNSERLRIGKGLDSDVQLGIWTQITTAMPQVWSFEKC